MTTLLLIRHAESQSNAAGTLAGRLPGVALTERGREQARELGERLVGLALSSIVCSPMQRCRETAEAAGLASATVVEDLTECGYGAWTNRALAELATDPLWRVIQDTPAQARFPESEQYAAESLTEMAERVWGVLTRLDRAVAEDHGEHALWAAVSHGDPIKAALAHAAGAGTDGLQRFRVDPASVSVISWAAGRPTVVAVNTLTGALTAYRPRRHEEEVGGGSGE